MSNKLILLSDLLTSKEEHNNITKCEVNYTPDKKTISIPIIEEGIDEETKEFLKIHNQNFRTENFKYYPFLNENNNPCLISKGVTKQQLYLLGKVGFDNGLRLMKKICSLYNSKELNAKGILITEEIIRVLPDHILKTKSPYDTYFINKKIKENGICGYDSLHQIKVKQSLYYIFTCRNGEVEQQLLAGDFCANLILSASIRPVINLPTDIMVDESEIVGKKLKLYKKQ